MLSHKYTFHQQVVCKLLQEKIEVLVELVFVVLFYYYIYYHMFGLFVYLYALLVIIYFAGRRGVSLLVRVRNLYGSRCHSMGLLIGGTVDSKPQSNKTGRYASCYTF